MELGTTLAAGTVLVAVLGVGTLAHELSHAFVLRAFGVPHALELLPDREGDAPGLAALAGRFAAVTPTALPATLAPWKLRLAALAPLSLAGLAFAVVGLGDVVVRHPVELAAVVGWLACALPSPQDFSLFWHADRVLAGDHGPA